MREIIKEDVVNIKRRFDEFAETAEQPMFYAMVKPHMLLDHTIQCFEDYKQKELESIIKENPEELKGALADSGVDSDKIIEMYK